ncbi:MAG: tetratricopeptide repeat protein [Desulfobacteraceae bacterium]|nr:tetratricopeptide repeat protein [Desulfobacteraceae bacterium]
MLNEKYNLAETYFKKAIKLEPDFMLAVNALGAVYLKVEKWDKAIKYLNKSAHSLLYPTPHYSLTNLGWAYIGKKEYELAKDYFLEALKKSPNYLSALHGFATVSLKTNSEQFAIRKLESALQKYPEVMIINYDLARIYEKLGNYLLAKEFWEKVIRLAPKRSKFIEEAENRLEKM